MIVCFVFRFFQCVLAVSEWFICIVLVIFSCRYETAIPERGARHVRASSSKQWMAQGSGLLIFPNLLLSPPSLSPPSLFLPPSLPPLLPSLSSSLYFPPPPTSISLPLPSLLPSLSLDPPPPSLSLPLLPPSLLAPSPLAPSLSPSLPPHSPLISRPALSTL